MSDKSPVKIWTRLIIIVSVIGIVELVIFFMNPSEIRAPIKQNAQLEVIPSYQTVGTRKRLDGEIQGEVVIPSFSQQTSIKDLEKVAQLILKKEHWTILDVYVSVEAQKANDSSSFQKAHPKALAGYLGHWEKGIFKSTAAALSYDKQ